MEAWPLLLMVFCLQEMQRQCSMYLTQSFPKSCLKPTGQWRGSLQGGVSGHQRDAHTGLESCPRAYSQVRRAKTRLYLGSGPGIFAQGRAYAGCPSPKPVFASTRSPCLVSPCLVPPYEPYLCLHKHLQEPPAGWEADRRPLKSKPHIHGKWAHHSATTPSHSGLWPPAWDFHGLSIRITVASVHAGAETALRPTNSELPEGSLQLRQTYLLTLALLSTHFAEGSDVHFSPRQRSPPPQSPSDGPLVLTWKVIFLSCSHQGWRGQVTT